MKRTTSLKLDFGKEEPKDPIDSGIFYLGIDPGASGAMAMIDQDCKVHLLKDWPGDEVEVAKIIKGIKNENIHAAIEKVHAMPRPAEGKGMSSIASFKFGTNFGIWRMGMAMADIPFVLVSPQQWQKGMISKAQDKKPALAAAARLFPKAELYGPRGGGKDGRADALLIAYWCLREFRK